ncbi:alpha/beta fold hydrolase [Salinarimonas ramus]|uniref:alpha/beta fold hydrolase n=1 Tax=Salinarimonas ramus TaxID=690164 RepID=UPI001666C0C8|nr:alpha/beta fold hydrolase [Salinarimonas ramus]
MVAEIAAVVDGVAEEAVAVGRLDDLPQAPVLAGRHSADLDAMIVVLDRQGSVTSRNAAANRLLRLLPDTSLADLAETPAAGRAFLAAVTASGEPVPLTLAGPDGRSVLMLGAFDEAGEHITLREIRRGLGERAQQRLAECIGLTAGEQRVCARLMAGRSIAEIAAELERKESTVRQQVKSILEKAGVRSQVQLISLAYSLSLAVERASATREGKATTALIDGASACPGAKAGYHRFGLEGGLPVLLFHGALFGIAALAEVRSSARALGLDVVAPERPGYGATRLPDGADPVALAVEHAVATLDALGWRQVVLLSHDIGTRFAARFAVAHPERVAALVAAPATPPMRSWSQTADMPTRHRVNAWAAQKLPAVMDKIVMLALARIARRGVELVPQLVFSDCPFDEAVLAHLDRRVVLEEVFSLVWRQRGAGFRRDMLLTNEDWSDELPYVAAPFVALHGSRSLTVSRNAVEGMAAAAPQGHFRLVEEAGHSLPLSHAPLVFRYVLAAGIRAGLGGAEHGVL